MVGLVLGVVAVMLLLMMGKGAPFFIAAFIAGLILVIGLVTFFLSNLYERYFRVDLYPGTGRVTMNFKSSVFMKQLIEANPQVPEGIEINVSPRKLAKDASFAEIHNELLYLLK